MINYMSSRLTCKIITCNYRILKTYNYNIQYNICEICGNIIY